jgi:uncharacterized membrane protein YdbT with pleckstrin-like domain
MDVQAGLVSGERVVFATTKHWIAPVADSKWAGAELLFAAVLAWLQTSDSTGILGFVNRVISLVNIVLVVSAVALIAYNIVAWRTAEYYVTNRRVLGTEGLLRRRSTDSLLTSVSDVRTSVSFLGRNLHYGNLKLLTSAGDPGADTFTAVRDVEAFKKHMIEQKAGAGAIAEARGVGVAPAADAPPGAATVPTTSAAEVTKTLTELAKLRDAGAITAQDYESKKMELLARI